MKNSCSPVYSISSNSCGKISGVNQLKARTTDFAFFLMAIPWALILFYLAKNFAVSAFWIVPLSVFIVSTPITICGIYSCSVKKLRAVAGFKTKGIIHSFITAKPLMIITSIFWALFTSFFMLIQFHTYNTFEWVSFFTVIPVFFLVFNFCKRRLSKELKSYLVTSFAISLSCVLTPLIMLVIYYCFLRFSGDIPNYSSLEEAINAQKCFVADMIGSVTVYETSQYLALYNGFKTYIFSDSGSLNRLLPFLFFSLGGFVVFFNACVMLSCFLIPSSEYRRIFGTPTDTEIPPPVKPVQIFKTSLLATFIVLFIYIPFSVVVEISLQQNPNVGRTREKVEALAIQSYEQIDDYFFKEGTIAQIELAKLEAIKKIDASFLALGDDIDYSFSRLEDNVDNYLDGYYSLWGEYSRIISMLTGELESYMKSRLEEDLFQGNVFNELQYSINNAIAAHKEIQGEYKSIIDGIMKENKVAHITETSFHITQQISLNNLLNPSDQVDFIAIEQRIAISGGAGTIIGGVTSRVVGKIIAKTLSKGTFKIAAKAMAKVVAKKAAASAGGASIGATVGGVVGSLVGPVGTAAGVAFGGAIGGVVAGVSMDKLILELEEHLSRDEFKENLLSCISEARDEFKKELQL